MKQYRSRFPRARVPRARILGALALGWAACLVPPGHAAVQERSLTERFESWRLGVATGILTPAARAELDALAKEAEAAAAQEGAPEAVRDALSRIEAERRAIAPKAAAARQGIQAAPEEEVLDRSILASLGSGNLEFIERLGGRAVPALAALAKATDGSPTPEGELDPLKTLFRVDRAAGMDAALGLMSSKSFLVKRATLQAVAEQIGSDDLYEPVGDRDWAFKNPEWRRTALLAFEEPAISAEAMKPVLFQLIQRGLLPRELADEALAVASDHRHGGPIPEAGLWFIERRLEDPSPTIRAAMVEQLARAGVVGPILRLAEDPSLDVRRRLAAVLVRTPTYVYRDRMASTQSDSKLVYPPFDAELFEAFKALATSEDETTANEIWGDSFQRLEVEEATKLSAEQLRELIPLARMPYQLWAIAAHAKAVPAKEQVPLVKAVIAKAAKRPFTADEFSGLQIDLMRIAKDVLTAGPGEAFWEIAFSMGESLKVEEGAAKRISLTAMELAGQGLIEAEPMVEWLDRYGALSHWTLASGSGPNEWMSRLSQSDRGRALKAYWRAYDREAEPGTWDLVTRVHPNALVSDPGVQREILADGSVHPLGRYCAAMGLGSGDQGAFDDFLIEPIADTLVRLDEYVQARLLMDLLPSTEFKNLVMRAMLVHPGAQDPMLLKLEVEPDRATFDALVKRFPMDTWVGLGFREQIWHCVAVLLDRSVDELHPILDTVCFSHPTYTERTASRIAGLRTPALFPLARRILEAHPVGSSTSGNLAVDAIAGYFSNEAAEVLLEAAKVARSEEGRTRIMTALRQITEWREAAASWERGAGTEAKRAKAIAGLVATVGDKTASLEARAASIRGLGLLGAVEELPRIIAALASDEPEMAAAARAALERLEK